IHKKTPVTIRFLLPGEYRIRIEKDNYEPWEKRLSILPGQVTLAHPGNDKIPLFLKAPKVTPENVIGNELALSQDSAWSWQATSTIFLLQLDTEKIIETGLASAHENNFKIEYSQDKNWAFVLRDGVVKKIVNLLSGATFDLPEFRGQIIEAQSLDDNQLLLRTSGNTLYQLEPETQKYVLRKKHVTAFAAAGDLIYFAKDSTLYSMKKASSTPEIVAASLPNFSSAKLMPTSDRGLFVLINNNLYQAQSSPRLIASSIKDARWYEEEKILLFFDDYNIWSFSPDQNNNPDLVTRSTAKLALPQLVPAIKQIFYLENGKIKTIEQFAQGTRLIRELAGDSDNKIIDFAINSSGELLYYRTQDSQIFKAQIR
ncbi:MAG: PEGA domain-containing protein, partial [bacterium]|nr:PEGA domain-containing protein [bacterium]